MLLIVGVVAIGIVNKLASYNCKRPLSSGGEELDTKPYMLTFAQVVEYNQT
jgi:hypothetical protein